MSLRIAALQPLESFPDAGQHGPNLPWRDNVDIVQLACGEVHSGFEQSDEGDELFLHWSYAPRQGTAELLRGHARLLQRLCGDEVLHGLGLRQVDPPIQKGPLGELPGLRQPRAGRKRRTEQRLQHDGRAMRGDLDDILAGVGMRSGESGHHGLVYCTV